MRFRATTKWGDLGELEGLLFFAQRAEELLFDYTLDSYKPAALNSVYICGEAIRLIRDIDQGLINKINLTPVMQELAWSISKDIVAKSLLDLPAEKYLLDHESEPLQRVRAKLEVLGRTLDPYRYLDRCCEVLAEAVRCSKKLKIDRLSHLLFTTLINLGSHKSHLYEKTIEFFYRGGEPVEIDSPDAIDAYLKKIYPVQHEFEVLFLASSLLSDVKDSAEAAFAVKFHDEIPGELADFASSNQFVPDGVEVIAQVDRIRALDCYTAREEAEGRLGQLRDLFTLYHHKTQICWRNETLIRQCCEEQPRIVVLPKNPIEKGYDQKPERASQQLNRMLQSFRMSGRDFQKFNRAVDFHGLSVSNGDPENQLLNLWIALETIVPTHTGTAKITQIIDGLLPFLAMNYIWRLVGRLTQDLLRWNRKEVARVLRLVPGDRKVPLRKKVFLLLVQTDAEDARNQLYSSLKDFHLLRFRVFTMSKSLATPKKAYKMLELHERKVSWQLRRIYRTRNLIVHSGRTPPYVQTLIENGHDYLDQVLLTITRMAGSDYKVRTIEQAFELAHVGRRKLEGALMNADAYTEDTVSIVVNEHDFI
jgi:hypothetical protein